MEKRDFRHLLITDTTVYTPRPRQSILYINKISGWAAEGGFFA